MDGDGMRVMTQPATPSITTDKADEFRHQADRRALWRAGGNSLLLHGLLLALLIGLWRVTPPDEIALPLITVKFEGASSAGSPGGGGGTAALPGKEPGAAAKPEAAATPQATPAGTPIQTSQASPPLPVPKPAPTLMRQPPPPKPKPSPAAQAPPAPAEPAATPAPPTTQSIQTATTASPAGAGRGSEGADSAGNGNVGRSEGAVGNGTGSGSGDDYLDLLRRHLNRYKKYPEEAIKQKQEGTVLIGFELAHDGTVTKAWIEQSSGNDLLDQAALAMMHDASPVPAVPERYWDKKGPIILPVDFSIGFFDKILR
jgi:periplasmic protein TonB